MTLKFTNVGSVMRVKKLTAAANLKFKLQREDNKVNIAYLLLLSWQQKRIVCLKVRTASKKIDFKFCESKL